MANFYVSPMGNDTNSGLDASSAFATLERAQEAMRQSAGADTAYLAGGTYRLDQPLQLTSADTGSSFAAAAGEAPVVSGGTVVTGWTQGVNGLWSAQVDDAQVLQLTINGVRQVESRFPNVDPSDPIRGGWLWGQDVPSGADPAKSLAFNPSDFPAGHAPQAGQTVTVFAENGYANDHLTIESVNGNVMTFTSEANYDLGPASRFFVSEPVPDGVGEWSFDSQTHTLLFKAPEGFTGEGAVASADHSLFVIDGASDVGIKGLTFTDTAVAASDPATAAIEAHDVTGLTVEGNQFANVGLGVALHGSSSGNLISGNSFDHIWASAVALTAGTSGNRVTNNVIDHSNEVFVQYGSIDMQESARNQIDHNTISNVPRFGISEINYDASQESGGNIIEYNDIRHSGQQTPDVGAIYLFSADDPGAVGDTIRYNHIVDTGGLNTQAGGFAENWSSGIYLDNMASNAQIYGNFVQGTTFSGILIHGGSGNQIHDNTLLDNGKYGISTITADDNPITGNEIYQNFIEVSGDGSNTIDTDQTDPGLIRGNVYYNPNGGELTVADVSLASFQQQGGDVGSVMTTEAGFANTQAGDYSFTSGSTAQAHGIESAPFASIGASLETAPPVDTPVTTPGTEIPPAAPEPAQPVNELPPPVAEEPASPVAEPALPITAQPNPPGAALPEPEAPISGPVLGSDVISIPEVTPPSEATTPIAHPGSTAWGGWADHHSSWGNSDGGRNWLQAIQSRDEDSDPRGGGHNWFQTVLSRRDDDNDDHGSRQDHSSLWHWH